MPKKVEHSLVDRYEANILTYFWGVLGITCMEFYNNLYP